MEPANHTYTELNEAVPRFIQVLTHRLGEEGATRLCTLLKDTGAIIAGGSVLQAFQDAGGSDAVIKKQDIDIYVPVKTAKAFFNAFVRDNVLAILNTEKVGNIRERSYKSALYCSSFLQKNGIIKVYNYVSKSVEFDVMIVRNRRTPLQVVNNFDLTFCQIWFDGQTIRASHPEDIKQKSGTLQGEYVDLFLKGNKFLHNRIQKYGERGYKVVLDPQSSNKDITKAVRVLKSDDLCRREDDSILMKHWSSRVLLSWFVKIRDEISHHIRKLPSKHDNILIVPLLQYYHRQYTRKQDEFSVLGGLDGVRIQQTQDDGYDSEDYVENPSLFDMIYNQFLLERTPTDLVQIPDEPTLEMKQFLFHRGANKLFEIAMWPNMYNYRAESLGFLLEQRKRRYVDARLNHTGFDRVLLYYNELKSRCIRKGTSFITQEEDVEVYDLHEHPMEAGISAEDMEGYLQHHITDADKSRVPCYYKPNPADHTDPVNCQHMISLSEVKYITSKDFYDRYSAPLPDKLGLDQYMSHYNQTLGNVKTEDVDYGMEYHHSVCPFCIQFESRDSGCSYMIHENTRHEEHGLAPYCDPRFQIKELRDKYFAVSTRPEDERHLEFCAECGRPCIDHYHITTTAPYTKMELPRRTREDGVQIIDYAACPGGGRAELFARILAIRKVYREGGFTDPMEERKAAALAADEAPNNPELMAQGAAIFAQEDTARHWTNAPIPDTKQYNDPAYRTANNSNSNYDSNSNSQNGGKYRKTLKKRMKKSRKN